MIRYHHSIGADREAARDVFRTAYAFDEQASLPEIAKAGKIVPIEACVHLAPQKSILCLQRGCVGSGQVCERWRTIHKKAGRSIADE